MNWKMPTPETLWDGTVVLVGLGFVAFKKELLDWLKDSFKRLSQRLAGPSAVAKEMENWVKVVRKLGLDGLDAVVWLLLGEHKAQRVTVTTYVKKSDGTYSATCVSQALASEMPSVIRDLQEQPVESSVWEEIKRIHQSPERRRYVPDAQLVDNVPFRDALLKSGVWSAYYQTFPNAEGQPGAVLAISWHQVHPVLEEMMHHLHSSGVACGTILAIMEQTNKTSKT